MSEHLQFQRQPERTVYVSARQTCLLTLNCLKLQFAKRTLLPYLPGKFQP